MVYGKGKGTVQMSLKSLIKDSVLIKKKKKNILGEPDLTKQALLRGLKPSLKTDTCNSSDILSPLLALRK